MAGERVHAAVWIERAADDARRRLAHEEAARLYRLALDVGAEELDDLARCRLLVAVAGALQRAGLLAGRVEACTDAAMIARRLDRPGLLAEAVLTIEGGELDLVPERAVRRLGEEALAALGPEPTAARARLAANLADRCMYLGEYAAAERAAAEALGAARHCGDPVALVAALRARQLVHSGPDGVDERARLADELLALGERHDGHGQRDAADARMRAHLWRIDVAYQRGELAAVARELEPLARCVEELRTPTARWHLQQCRAVLAQAQGRFADARRLADRAVEVLPPYAGAWSSALINRNALLGTMTMQTGESPDAGVLPRGDGADPDEAPFDTDDVIFPIAAAAILAVGGRIAAARAVYSRLVPPGSWRPRPHTRTVCYGFGIVVAAALDAAADVAALRTLLAPYRDHHLSSGAGAVAYNGPATLYLGVAARYLGLLDDAVDDLEAADRACAAAGAAGFAVEARCELAAALAVRARPGDVARARSLAVDAAAGAGALGMTPFRERAGALVARIDDERDAPLTPREREVAALVALGLTNREIATRLFLSERTAQNHVQHILTKLGLRNRGQIAVRFAQMSGPVE